MSKKAGYQVLAVCGILLFCCTVSVSGSSKEDLMQEAEAEKGVEKEAVSVYADSPDGKYRAEAVGEESIGGWNYPELVQVRDLDSGQMMWSRTAYMDPAFFWSEDGEYLAVQSSGRTWTECTLIDCHTWNEIPAPDIQSVSKLAEEFPDPYENGCMAVIPLKWVAPNKLMLEIYWDVVEPSDSYRVEGTFEYEVNTQAFQNLNLQKVSNG